MELFGAISFFLFFFCHFNNTESNRIEFSMERKSNVKFDRNGNCSSVDSILSLSSMKIIFKKIFFYVLIPRTQRSNSQWRKNPIKFLLVFIKEFLLLLFFFLKYKIHIWRNKGDRSSWTLQLLSPINFIDENIQENFLLRFNTKNPFQDRILNGEKIPPRPFFFFFFWDTKFNDIEFQWQKFLNSLFRSIEIELSSAGNSEERRKESIDK